MTIDTQEMKLRILAEFDDKQMEDVYATLDAVFPDMSGELSEITLFCAALSSLVSQGVIVLALGRYRFNPRKMLDTRESLELVAQLPSWFRFDTSQRYWTLAKGAHGQAEIPIIVLTQQGEAEALKVQGNHGFRWWGKRK